MHAAVVHQRVPSAQADFHAAIATSPAMVDEACLLREESFARDDDDRQPVSTTTRRPDIFDHWCEHLVVRNRGAGRVVAAARILTSERAMRLGAYRSETAFDLTRLQRLRPYLLEVDGICIDNQYRNGPALAVLWCGVWSLLIQRNCRHVIGSVTVSLSDGGAYARALWRDLAPARLAPIEYRVFPRRRFDEDLAADTGVARPIRLPGLDSYVSVGAWLAAEPALAADEGAAEFCLFAPGEHPATQIAPHRSAA